MEEPGEFSFSAEVTITQRQLEIPEQTTITHMVLDSFGRRLVAGTKQGELLEWLLKDGADAKVRQVAVGEPGEAITALTYLLGERTLIVGTQAGRVMTWVPMNEFPDLASRHNRSIISFKYRSKIYGNRYDHAFLSGHTHPVPFLSDQD